ncbi:Hsp70 family protein [Mycobacterium servetii]|uniref:Hsp70 family protein n=1 Tax=Mycobacterium servetii TaxID=3237418 RepID=A0ABV4C7N9_9MYCO
MSESLGLSIGVANLVAAHPGGASVRRSPVVTLYEQRATEVGLPDENPNLTEPGLVLRGFVERVGDRTPLVAADGTKYLGEVLTVEAIEAMARTVGSGTPITVAVPAYWSEAQSTALREEFFAQPDLAAGGVPPMLVSDATAALAALRAGPGLPADGVVVVCDFGAGGTSITLSDAGSNFRQLAPSLRYADFSGDAIDRLVLQHVRGTAPDPDATTRMESPGRLLGQCRRAKEQLSAATAAIIPGVPGASGDEVRLTRTEFDQLISEPLDRVLDTVEEVLQRNGVARSQVASVAIVGGGAAIPLITTRLSGRLRLPVLAAPQPGYSAAIGAALLGEQRASAGPPTAAAAAIENPTEMVGAAPDDLTQAARTAAADAGNPDGQPVAWSQDADEEDFVPYSGPEHTGGYGREPRDDAGQDGPLPWYKRTALVLSLVGAGAAVLVAVLLALTLGRSKPSPSAPPPTPQTVTVTGPNNSPTVTVIPPPPPSTEPTTTSAAPTTSAPPTTTTTTAATTTTSAPPTTTATTTPAPTTTATTTTAPSTTSQATTTPPPTTTRELPFPRLQPPFGG